jgi:hypothetical protein
MAVMKRVEDGGGITAAGKAGTTGGGRTAARIVLCSSVYPDGVAWMAGSSPGRDDKGFEAEA